MAQPQTFFWHDYETSGANPRADRPMQFAGIRTDENFNIIGDPVMFYCQPAADMLPHPEACLITGITPQHAQREGLCETEFIQAILAELSQPNTCAVGYNSIRFDDEVTRNTLYRNFQDPYAREWQNGCSRWDIIDMLRLARAVRPEGINWPSYEDGRPSLRLEDLSKANSIEHANAHDALADVYATIAMAKLVKEAQPKLYQFAFTHRDKHKVQALLNVASMQPVLHLSSMYPVEQGNLAMVAPIAQHPTNKNAVIVWDLRYDPVPLAELDGSEIERLLYTPRAELAADEPRIALKEVHINKCPIVAPLNVLAEQQFEQYAIDQALAQQYVQQLQQMPNLQQKLTELYSSKEFKPVTDPDLMLYTGGFFSAVDKSLMQQVVRANVADLLNMQLSFQDARLDEMLLRYKARNYPESLNTEEQQQWHTHCQLKLAGGAGESYLSLDQFNQRLNELAADSGLTEADNFILQELYLYGQSLLA